LSGLVDIHFFVVFCHQDKVVEKTHEVALHTEDMEDSICAVRSMAEFGVPLADDMIKGISYSLQTMSKAQPKRGYIYGNIGYIIFHL
jgi:hypothetical protein